MDIEVGRHALRTFNPGMPPEKNRRVDGKLVVTRPQLRSLFKSDHFWKDGVSVAQCKNNTSWEKYGPHDPPHDECTCGLYGTLTIDQLIKEYPEYAKRSIGVIAAEGPTVIGDRGLRTSAARIVAWWVNPLFADEIHLVSGDATYTSGLVKGYKAEEIYRYVCKDAKQYTDLAAMLKDFGFPDPVKGDAWEFLKTGKLPAPEPYPRNPPVLRASVSATTTMTLATKGSGVTAIAGVTGATPPSTSPTRFDHMLFNGKDRVPWTYGGLRNLVGQDNVDFAWKRLQEGPPK